MLTDLHIRNLAVLEAASIEFGPGFNVLSGETGAGKSIVVDSLALLSGVRASTELIRTGAETLTVTGVFHPEGEAWRRPLEAAGLEPQGDELVIRREVSRAGRNRVFVDDQPVTLKLLADLAPSLLRIHGQREELGLVDPELQRTWLDRCGGAQAAAPLRSVAKAFDAYRTLALRLERLTGDERARQERIDFLRFQLSEIDGAGLEAGEEDALRQEREVLRHAEAIQQGLSQAAEVLFDREGAAHGALARALQALQGIVDWEPAAAAWAGEVEELEIRLGEMESALRRRIDEVEADPRRLDAVEDRLAVLERLLSKYGATSADVLALRDRLDGELAELEDAEGSHAELEAQITEALERYRVAAEKLTAARKRWAKRLTTRVHEHLRGLALGKARFEVDLEPRRRQGSPLVVGGNG
ncbi:MAG: AAA family ATPase, partial [Acidobacteriota bacterium]